MSKSYVLKNHFGSTVCEVGEYTKIDNLYTGDIVAYTDCDDKLGRIRTSVIVKGNNMYIRSMPGINLYQACQRHTVKKVLSYKHLTNEILEEVTGEKLFLAEVEVKEMTVEEIERELGYRVKIVGNEEDVN